VSPATLRRVVAGAYAGIAVVATFAPERVPAIFGGSAPTPAARTEVRTVYAGIPCAFAAVLAAPARPDDEGALRAVEAACAGMAAARFAGAGVERRLEPWPTGAFLALEVALAAALRRARRAT
jgi:Domain of unknown function (DUF4345)